MVWGDFMGIENTVDFNLPKTDTSKQNKMGKKTVVYRWIIALVLIPLFCLASDFPLAFSDLGKVILGLIAYNSMVTYYLVYEYPRSRHVPDYVHYIDIFVISILSFLFGGISSDIYIMYIFIIAAHAVANNPTKSLKFSITVVGMYSISTLIYGTFDNSLWIITDEFLKLLSRNVILLIFTYSLGLIINEVRRADNLHKKEFLRARTDKLTGLPNRHHMEQMLEEELRDCKEHNKVMNVLMFDIDNFKRFNDTYGHTWGDELLKRFAGILDQSVRKSDVPVRYGGEEFIVLVKDIDFVTALGVANRVRRQLENQKIDVDDGVEKTRVTVSCGVAQYPTHSDDINRIIELADESLYFAKEHGKNVVVGYEDLEKYRKTTQDGLDVELEKTVDTKVV